VENEVSGIECRLQDASEELWAKYEEVRRKAEQLMMRAHRIFRNYTDHGPAHYKDVISRTDELLTPDVAQSLGPEELFALLAGATWHDRGMVTEEEHLSEDDVEQLRQTHQDVGAQKIREDPEAHGIPPNFAIAVSQVVRHHRESDIAREVEPTVVRNSSVRLPLLCALVRAADELALTERAPKIVAEMLDLPEDSVQHFEQSDAVDGVAVDSGTGIIQVCAKAHTEAMARALQDLETKIKGELVALAPLFAEHGLPEYVVRFDIAREALVRQKVLIALCAGPATLPELGELASECEAEIRHILQELRGDHLVQVDSETTDADRYYIRAEVQVFGEVADALLDTDQALDFLQSEYGKDMLRGLVFDDLLEAFSGHYPEEAADLRRDVLCASPTAVRLALSSADAARSPAPVVRRVFLDQTLLLGMTRDIERRPQVSELLDVGRALRSLARQVSQEAPNFARLLARAWSYRDKSAEEMRQLLMDRHGGPTPSDGGGGIRFTVESPEAAPYLSLAHLMIAASEEGVPLEFAGRELGELQLYGMQVQSRMHERDAASRLRIEFRGRSPELPRWRPAVGLEWDEDNNTCTITVDTERSYDPVRYPFRIQFTEFDPVAEKATFTFVKHVGRLTPSQALSHIAVQQALGMPRRAVHFVMVDSQTGQTLVELDADARQSDEAFRARSAELIAHLYALREAERRLGSEIELPLLPSAEQREKLSWLSEHIEGMSDRDLQGVLDQALGAEKPEVTLIRIMVTDQEGRTIVDECPRVFPGLPDMNLVIDQAEYQSKVDEAVATRSQEMALHYFAGESPKELVERYVSAVEEGRLDPPCMPAEPRLPLPTQVDYRLTAVQETGWERVQRFILEVRPESEAWRMFGEALVERDKGDFESECELLVQCIVDHPQFGPAHFELGIARYNLSQIEPAEKALRNALEVGLDERGEGVAWSYIGTIPLHRGDSAAAIEGFKQIPRVALVYVVDDTIERIQQRLIAKGIYVDECEEAIAYLRGLAEKCDQGAES